MPIACVRVPHFSIHVALHDRPDVAGTPVILRGEMRGQPAVIDATHEAARLGVHAGQQLREATALVPLATVAMPDPVREAQTAVGVMAAFLQVSPLAEPDDREPGCWYVDLVGLDRQYGTQEAAAASLLRCVPSHLKARIGVAPTKFAARVAAGVTTAGNVLVIAAPQLKPFLSGAAVSWLPIDPRVILDMQDVGIDALGELAAMEVGKVSARFGPAGILAWELANGTDRRQVTAPALVPSVTVDLAMPAPAASREMLLVGVRQLVTRAFGRRELRGRYVREAVLRAVLEDGRSWERSLVLKTPSDAARLITSLDLRLRDIAIPGPVERIALTMTGIVTEAARQQMVTALKPRDASAIQDVIDQLRLRYGSSPLYRFVEAERWSRHPERQFVLMRMTSAQ